MSECCNDRGADDGYLRGELREERASFHIGPGEDERQTFNVCPLQPCCG